MFGSGTKLLGRIRLFPSVRYCNLPSAVWCGAVHTFSHTGKYLEKKFCKRLTGSAVITHDVTTGTGYCLVSFNWIIDFLN